VNQIFLIAAQLEIFEQKLLLSRVTNHQHQISNNVH